MPLTAAGALLVNTSQAFFIPIQKSRFAPGFANEDEIEFIPSVAGMPELPEWMSYRFDNESRTGFLYGSPSSDGNVEIEVIALNTHSFETQRDSVKLSIIERDSESICRLSLVNCLSPGSSLAELLSLSLHLHLRLMNLFSCRIAFLFCSFTACL